MLKAESYKKGLVKSTILNIVAKAIMFLNTIVVAFYFGTNVEADIYFYIFSSVTLIAALINIMDLSVIVPEGMQLQEKQGLKPAMQFYNFFGYRYFVIGGIFWAVLFLFSVPIYAKLSAFNEAMLGTYRELLLLSSALPLVIILSNYLTAVLTTFKFFTAPLFANGIAQTFSLITLAIFHKQLGVSSAIVGLLAGYVVNVVLLLAFMRFRLHWEFRYTHQKISKRIYRNLLSVQLGNLSTFAYNFGIIFLLGRLSTGVYAAYNYSMQVVNVPVNFLIVQTTAVAGIKFNELASKRLFDQINKIFQDTVGILLFLVVPICFITWMYADKIVDIIFLRGDFGHQSAAKVVLFLKYLIFLLPCILVNTFIGKLMTAGKKVSQAFYFQVGFNAVLFVLLFVASSFYQETGFIFSMLGGYYLYVFFACIFLFKWLMPYIDYLKVVKNLGRTILLNLPLVWVFYYLSGFHHSIFSIALLSVFYYVSIAIANRFFKVDPFTNTYLSNISKLIQLKIK